MLKENTIAPQFTFRGPSGKLLSLESFRGQWVLLYFYPKDDTPGCTMEACAIRDNFPDFEKFGAAVIGVSADSEKSHTAFMEKHKLPFLLLADQGRKLIRSYGAGRLIAKRVSYLIDPQGSIRKVYPHVVPGKHAEEVLKDIRIFSSHDKHQR
jgi:peroxiredoxin Q/BCP